MVNDNIAKHQLKCIIKNDKISTKLKEPTNASKGNKSSMENFIIFFYYSFKAFICNNICEVYSFKKFQQYNMI